MKKFLAIPLSIFCGVSMLAAQEIVDFEELPLAPESHWNGSDMSGIFISKYIKFYNEFTDWGGGMYSWTGFSYTNETDATSYTFENQYSAASGHGNNNSENYAVAYVQSDWMNNYIPIPISLKINKTQMGDNFPGMFVSLNAYASLYMDDQNIYENAKHWYKLIIKAFNAESSNETSKEFILADYRFESLSPLKLNEWTYINMEWAAFADSLTFIVTTSDWEDYGPNTPTYFCLDDIAAPEPMQIPEMITELPNEYSIMQGDSVELVALVKGGVQPYTFTWNYQEGLNNYNIQNPIARPQQTTEYTVTISDATGNQEIRNVRVNVSPTIIESNSISLFSVDNSNKLKISGNNMIGNVIIYDIYGRKILEKYINENYAEFDIDYFSKSIYIVKIPKYNYTTKILK